MSEFKGTKGEWKALISFGQKLWIVHLGRDRQIDHVSKEDAILIAEAGNVRQQINCSLTELFEQRNELLESLQEVRTWYEENHEKYLKDGDEYLTPVCFNKAYMTLLAINKTK